MHIKFALECQHCAACGAEHWFPTGEKPPSPYPCDNPECPRPDDIYKSYDKAEWYEH